MNKRLNPNGPICQTSEKEPEVYSQNELTQIKNEIGRRMVEAFNFYPDSEIAFLLKTSCKTIKAYAEGEEFPPTEILLAIHKTTGVSLHWLLTGEGTKRPMSDISLVMVDESPLCGLA